MCSQETIENSWSVCECRILFEIEVRVPSTEMWILFDYADSEPEARGRVRDLQGVGIRARAIWKGPITD